VLIVLLKVCFNAFQGGIYIKKGMFNHSCRPNCETFGGGERPGRNAGGPAPGGGGGGGGGVGGGGAASEIVANTDIPAGTELSISYLFPIEQTHASRRHKFEKQHFW
jgi:SET domain-containing protein